MIQCPDCRQIIPEDSAFCDQCGKELKWCPECKRPKRGTECPVCGSDPPAALVGNGWRLTLQEGPFGRRGGIWPELSTCQYVSGSHGNIVKAGADWVIEDVGSTNGTYVNGARIQRQALKKGDRVKIATLEFTVE